MGLIAEEMEQHGLDVLAVSETHIPFGSIIGDLVSGDHGNYFTFLGPASSCSSLDSASSRPKGGVGMVFRCESVIKVVTPVTMMDRNLRVRQHVAWFTLEVTDGRSMATVHVGSVYIPPRGGGESSSACTDDGCTDVECALDHTAAVMQCIRDEGDALVAGGGQLLVLGDWNAMPPVDATSWDFSTCRSVGAKRNWKLLQPVLCRDRGMWWELANPLASPMPTRIDPPSGRASILDLVFFQPASGAAVSGFMTSEVPGKDHWLVECTFHAVATQLLVEVVFGHDGVSPLYVTKCTSASHPRYRLTRLALVPTAHTTAQWERASELFDDWWGRVLHGGEPPALEDVNAVAASVLQRCGLLLSRAAADVKDPTLLELLQERGDGASLTSTNHLLLREIRSRLHAVKQTRSKLNQLRARPDQHSARTQRAIAKQSTTLTAREQGLAAAHAAGRAHGRELRQQQARAIAALEFEAAEATNAPFRLAQILGAVTRSPGVWRAGMRGSGRRPARVLRPVLATYSSLQEWRGYLSRKYSPLRPPVPVDLLFRLSSPSSNVEHVAILDGDVSATEVEAALLRLRNEAAALSVPIRAFKMLALAAPQSLEGLAGLLTSYLRGAPMPSEVTTVTLHPILKPGRNPDSKDNWRTIGFGTTVSRVLQTVVASRLKQYIVHSRCLHRAQAGFLPKLSADMMCWLTTVICEDAVLAGSTQFSCFVDVKAAFASTGHVDVAEALLRVGVQGSLATLIMSFLQQSSVYIAEEGYRCQSVRATVGLIEGCTFSPLLWDIVMDSLLCNLDTAVEQLHESGLDVGPIMGDCKPLPATAYADDVRLIAHSVVLMQDLLDTTQEWMVGKHLELGVAPDKTAGLLHHLLEELGAPLRGDRLRVGERELPLVEVYKYLGLLASRLGVQDSAKKHRALLLSRIRSAIGYLRFSGIRQVRPAVATISYLTRVRPKLTYGLETWGLYSPKHLSEFVSDDTKAQSIIVNADGPFPHVVLNALLGIPSLPCELDRAVVRLILRVVALPEGDMYRRQMAKACRRWKGASSSERTLLQGTWWPQALRRLHRLDDCSSAPVRKPCPYRPVQTRFVETIERLLLERELPAPTGPQPGLGAEPCVVPPGNVGILVPDAPRRLVLGEDYVYDHLGNWRPVAIAELEHCLQYVTDWAAWRDNQVEMDGMSSLTATRDLLCGRPCDGKLPFLSRDRSVHQTYLMHLPAGTHYLLGYAHHDASCPWCNCGCEVTVPHLLRDCPALAVARQQAVSRMHAAAVKQGVMSADVPVVCTDPEYTDLWYHLMVGHPVPRRVARGALRFVDVLVFPGMEPGAEFRHSRRPSVDPSDRQRYFAVLDGAKQFVVDVLRGTQEAFGVVRRSTFGARVDPSVVIPLAPAGAKEQQRREQRHRQRAEARRGEPDAPPG